MSNYLRYCVPNSIVFITIVTYNRKKILLENVDLLRNSIKFSPYKFDILAGAIMPDHLHILIKPNNMSELSKIISSIKYGFSKFLPKDKNLSQSKISKGEKGIWQRRFYDHIIRDEEDYYKHLDYIHYNPIKHGYVKTAKNWEYSSFNKFVKLGLYENDWCNFEDKHNIHDLNIK